MPTPPADLQYIKLNDFSHGIADNPGSNYPPGQAQRTNTFRCIANRQGALVPLPRRDYGLNGVNYATPQSGYFIIVGFYVDPVPVLPTAGTADGQGRVHNIFVAVKYANGGSEQLKVELFRQYLNPVTHSTIDTASVVSTDPVASAFGMSFVGQRTLRSSPTSPGVPIVAYSNFSVVGGAMSFWRQWPDDANPVSDGVRTISNEGGLLCSHQNRIIQRLLTAYSNGASGTISTTEDLKWTDANNTGTVSIAQVFYPEETNGYGLMASMSANELFMLKEQGGLLVSGDVANPTVINLPMVAGADVAALVPARSIIGLVYGNRSGVWVWSHGDTTQLISPRLDPKFWLPTNQYLTGEQYRFQSWQDWVAVPNNWLYDTQLKSWWRLEDPSILQTQRYGLFRQFLYADLQTYTAASPLAVVGWNRDLKATSYSWQSHPIWATIDRITNVREITCRAIGTGTVAVTVTASNGSTRTVTFTYSDNNVPHVKRSNFRLTGSELVVSLVVTGTGGNDALTVEELQLGVADRERVPVNS